MVIYTRLWSLLCFAVVVISSHGDKERSDLKQDDKHLEICILSFSSSSVLHVHGLLLVVTIVCGVNIA